MKQLMLCALLGGLSVAAPAQTTSESEVRVRGYQISLPDHKYVMLRKEFDAYTGDYTLSNGQLLTLTRDNQRMYAQLGRGERKELVAAKANEFVALDRDLRITLERDEFSGDFGGEVLMVPRSSSEVAAARQPLVLVARR